MLAQPMVTTTSRSADRTLHVAGAAVAAAAAAAEWATGAFAYNP